MPYIKQDRRRKIKDVIDVIGCHLQDEGELNFAVTELCLHQSRAGRYADWNRIIGVLSCVQLEFYRRMVAPYEDKKAIENGDVFPAENRLVAIMRTAKLRFAKVTQMLACRRSKMAIRARKRAISASYGSHMSH